MSRKAKVLVMLALTALTLGMVFLTAIPSETEAQSLVEGFCGDHGITEGEGTFITCEPVFTSTSDFGGQRVFTHLRVCEIRYSDDDGSEGLSPGDGFIAKRCRVIPVL